jgi:DNA-binding response OmpR family regulator
MAVSHTLLVVDDNQQICEFLTDYLSRDGYTVVCARDGAEALAALDSRKIDLAIIDLLLPGAISGEDVAACAAATRVKVITMSGALASDSRGRDLRTPHLSKPFRGGELVVEVRAMLGG